MKLFSEISGDGLYVVQLAKFEVETMVNCLEYIKEAAIFGNDWTDDEDRVLSELKALTFMDSMVTRAENGRIADLLAEHFGAAE